MHAIVACTLLYLHLSEVCACLVMSRGNIHDMHFPSYHVLYEACAAKVCVHACMHVAAHGLSCPKGTYITDYDVQGYAFPLITMHVL